MNAPTSMKPTGRRTRRAVLSYLFTLAAITSVLGLFGCEDPVSDDADVTVTGRVLDSAGEPLANQEVQLFKSDLSAFTNDFLLGVAIEVNDPFRTTTTDADGTFAFEMNGEDANTSTGRFAAYFAVVATTGDEADNAVGTYEFQFSNQELTEELGDLQFWDGVTVAATDDAVGVTWEEAPTAPRNGVYNVVIQDRWTELATGTSADIDIRVLANDETEADIQMLALGNDRRYRTSVSTFSYDASESEEPLDYTDEDNNNRSGTNCDGDELFDLNDGLIVGSDGIENFGGLLADDARCVQITLRERTRVSDIFLYNAFVFAFDSATVEVEARDGEGDWTTVGSFDKQANDFATVYGQLTGIDEMATDLRFTVTGNENAFFESIGEIEVYGEGESVIPL